ncbi:uncharacterized protein TrAtP1_012770 [Trichoderma atroviride]|uniref:uncharacterized protein n=1 Tax=Hypocrea atroviridis TaxID=63577 RepID=UPI003316D0A8|nr:hypothetical protein TrAtP1_012770 [Trichoderma atroviride]
MTARWRPRAVEPRRFETGMPFSYQSAAVDLRDEGITEAEARKRLSSYVVVHIEKSLPAIDGEGNLIPSTWDKASHTVLSDIPQQEARHSVRELNRETGCVSDKKSELSSALQRQLERAHTRLENMEPDCRYIYTLVQLGWKFRKIEAPTEYHGRRGKHGSKDRRRDKERHKSKPRKERVSVTAYFKREPSSNANCLKMYNRQQGDKKGYGRQLSSSRMERQLTPGSQSSKSSTTSFSSFSSNDSHDNPTPNSSVDDISAHRNYEERRGRSRYRQSRNGEPLEIMVARLRPRRDSVGRYDCIPPPVPDPTRPEPTPAMDSPRRMARSRSVRDSSRQPRLIQSPLEKQRGHIHNVPYHSSSGKDVKQLGDRFSRASLADEPRNGYPETASDLVTHHTYREPLRQYHGEGDEELRVPEPSGTVWRKQDAQRYMNSRRRFDQDPWDLGRSSPLLYAESGREYR